MRSPPEHLQAIHLIWDGTIIIIYLQFKVYRHNYLTCTDVECVGVVLLREFPLLRWGLVDHTQQLHPPLLKLQSIQPTSKVATLHELYQDLYKGKI